VIVTLAETRRQGVGRAMMDFAERLAREHGCEGMFLVSGLKRKDEAHHFFMKTWATR
jgi:GNAT superfamily N-acetyltransferase